MVFDFQPQLTDAISQFQHRWLRVGEQRLALRRLVRREFLLGGWRRRGVWPPPSVPTSIFTLDWCVNADYILLTVVTPEQCSDVRWRRVVCALGYSRFTCAPPCLVAPPTTGVDLQLNHAVVARLGRLTAERCARISRRNFVGNNVSRNRATAVDVKLRKPLHVLPRNLVTYIHYALHLSVCTYSSRITVTPRCNLNLFELTTHVHSSAELVYAYLQNYSGVFPLLTVGIPLQI
ncbi:hypothetical protein BDZ89DRAFT_1149866 [Hymenopellis radicata]|nr:hypothetical protein BDZ89DRAFT_1149866 [Hymenopellis radicata]